MGLVEGVNTVISQECKKHGNGGAVYIFAGYTNVRYWGMCLHLLWFYIGMQDPVKTFTAIESAARDGIIRHNGSISHHHGVGKTKKMGSEPIRYGMTMLKAVKDGLDPTNIMANGNIL